MRKSFISGTGCAGYHAINRRDFLKVGAISGLGLTLGDYFSISNAQAQSACKAESVIFVFLAGGLSQLETFDPKPHAPIENRGQAGIVRTNTGEVFGGVFGGLATVADKLAVVRSVTHEDATHERGKHSMMTGYRPSRDVVHPSMGSVISHELGARDGLPGYIGIHGSDNPFSGPGYLSPACGPFNVSIEPTAHEGSLSTAVDRHFAALEKTDLLDCMDNDHQRAYALLSSQSTREAFNLSAEPARYRETYGQTAVGQRLLLSRRLVEAGARFVSVVDSGWDMHTNVKAGMQNQAPALDKALTALITDLSDRGLIDKTLVVLTTEFGRTPRLNEYGGRDHWSKAFSVMMAGGGVKGGVIHGATDAHGAEPAHSPVEPQDIAATLFAQLGVDPSKNLMCAKNAPVNVTGNGRVIATLTA